MSERKGFDRIIGQELAKRMLMRAVREDRPAHAYLFLGPESTGKLTTALEFAKALNCESFDKAQDAFDKAQDAFDGAQDGRDRPFDRAQGACGECAVCHTIEHGNFPDIRVWPPGSKSGAETSIDQMREMRDHAVYQPVRGRWKVNIIEQGDTLNEESASCILKLVEEPPAYLINILIYRNSGAVLPTIRSRCRLVRFTQADTDELATRLVEDFAVDPDQARFLATYSQGRPGAAIGLIGNQDFMSRRDAVIVTAAGASSGKPWLALKLAETLRSGEVPEEEQEPASFDKAQDAKDEQEAATGAEKTARKKERQSARSALRLSLDMLLVWYRDLLAAKLQGNDAALVNCDKRQDVLHQASRYSSAGRVAAAIEAIIQTKRGILGNANPQIATEALMMRLVC